MHSLSDLKFHTKKLIEETDLPSLTWRWRSWQEIQSASLFTKINYVNILMFLGFVAFAIYQARSKYKESEKAGLEKRYLKAPDFPPVEELKDFDWSTTEPLQLRTFKPKYHLTMSLENLDPTELILMDKNYESRIKYRKQIMKEHTTNVVNVSDSVKRITPAIREYYTFMMGTYLPIRYPSMFKLHETFYESGQTFMLQNLVTGELHPASPPASTTSAKHLLETLGRTLDEDVLFLLPEEETEKDQDPKYVLHGYVACCPAGFDPGAKLGKKLADIHTPVPGYATKIASSMDRFFSRIEVGKYVKRANWSVTTHGSLYSGTGSGAKTHAHQGDEVEELKELDLSQTFLRCERQTLHRLPKSKAIVFSFKTYLYPIQQIKDEGLGEELAQAIDGLKEGNAPGMHLYKLAAVWGEATKKYLRS